MGITVSDIERKEFTYKGAGYDPYDVDQYLDQICDEMVAMQDRIVQLEKELEEAGREMEKAKHAARPVQPVQPVQPEPKAAAPMERPPIARTSETLETILINAQRLADDAVENANRKAQEAIAKAHKDAEETLGSAKAKAEEITGNAQAEKERIEAEYVTLKEKAASFKENFLKLLEEHKALLDRQLKENKEL
jgi:cell division initiation protein